MMSRTTRNEFLAACLAELRSAAVPYCISRNHGEFWKNGPSDVDMMVSPARLADAVRSLQAVARSSDYRLAAQTWFDNLSLTFHAPDAGFVRIDLDTAVRWRTRTLLDGQSLLAQSAERDGLSIPCPAHEALVLLCQCAWAGGVKHAYRKRLEELVASGEDSARVSAFLASRFGFDESAMTRLVSAGDVTELRTCFRRALISQRRIRNALALIRRAIRRLVRPPGIIIDCFGLSDAARAATAVQLELLCPAAKAARSGDRLLRICLTLFRGGIFWSSAGPGRVGGLVARLWVGRWRSFDWCGGNIRHAGSGRSADASDAARFIGCMLADSLVRSR